MSVSVLVAKIGHVLQRGLKTNQPRPSLPSRNRLIALVVLNGKWLADVSIGGAGAEAEKNY